MKKSAKEKRYFCDLWDNQEDQLGIFGWGLVIGLVAIFLSSWSLSNKALESKYAGELNSYSEDTYQYLYDIADNVICEGVGINTQALPDDVVEYEIKKNNDVIIFNYCLDNNKYMEYAPSANVTVILSSNYEIISKTPNFSSEEDYVGHMKANMLMQSLILALIICAVVTLAICIIGNIAGEISLKRKREAIPKNSF